MLCDGLEGSEGVGGGREPPEGGGICTQVSFQTKNKMGELPCLISRNILKLH